MGRPKAELFAAGVAAALSQVAEPVYEVGPSWTGLAALDDPGEGPLAAIAAAGLTADALVLACDLPFVTVELLRWLADQPGTAVPVVGGRVQPLCARYAGPDLARAVEVVAGGGRRMRDLLDGARVTWLDEAAWSAVAEARAFTDVDTPEDLSRL
jgi:molybdopterin-guanine dinucleotide biosynthesis protein A